MTAEKAKLEKLLVFPTVREALLYEKIREDKVRCILCERRCILASGQKGFCKTRINIHGKLYTMVWGDISAVESRPIEIKPFFHYWPGSTALTLSTWSCNFRCPWCQNHHLSAAEPNPEKATYIDPERIVNLALSSGDEGICVSFQEPTILSEFAAECFRKASSKGLYCCYVSNGYMTAEALQLLKDSGLLGLKIDVKGSLQAYEEYCGGADAEKVWVNARKAKAMGIHIEIVNLVVTGVNDDENSVGDLVNRHLKELGSECPLHFTGYYPAYKFNNPSTAVKVLEECYRKAKKEGVLYPYIGNVPAHRYENTYCSSCGVELIRRFGWRLLQYRITENNRCPSCGCSIPIAGRYVSKVVSAF